MSDVHTAPAAEPENLGIHHELQAEFERWLAQLGPDVPPSRFAVTATDVLKAHFLLADYFREVEDSLGGVGPKSLHLLHSALSRQYVGFGTRDKWQDLFGVTATLFFGLVKNHAFHDANKRTALLTSLYQLQSHNRVVNVPQKELEHLAVCVAENALSRYRNFREFRNEPDPEVRFISDMFRRSTRAIDKREFRVTYRQLAGILSRYGFRFGHSHDNRIEVLQDVEIRTGLFGLKRKMEEQRVVTIGFRSWGTEVSQKDLRLVREKTGLVHKNGYDTGVLLQTVNPMEVLIAEYSGPLRRLARK